MCVVPLCVCVGGEGGIGMWGVCMGCVVGMCAWCEWYWRVCMVCVVGVW